MSVLYYKTQHFPQSLYRNLIIESKWRLWVIADRIRWGTAKNGSLMVQLRIRTYCPKMQNIEYVLFVGSWVTWIEGLANFVWRETMTLTSISWTIIILSQLHRYYSISKFLVVNDHLSWLLGKTYPWYIVWVTLPKVAEVDFIIAFYHSNETKIITHRSK